MYLVQEHGRGNKANRSSARQGKKTKNKKNGGIKQTASVYLARRGQKGSGAVRRERKERDSGVNKNN